MRRTLIIIGAAIVAAAFCGFAAGVQPVWLNVPVLLVVPVILWQRPHYAVVLLVATATTIEEFPYTVGTHNGVFTSKIFWWRSFIHGMTIFPVEVLLLIAIVIWFLKAGAQGSFGLPKSPVKTCFKVFGVLLIIAVGIGLAHGAQLKFDLFEFRPWLYLSVAYLLAAALLQTRQALDLVPWAFVLGTGFKGIQGTIVFFTYARQMHPRPEEILGHEEAFFFGVFITITVALWLYDVRGRLRTTATCMLPFVVIADLANARRTAWLVLALSLATLLAIALTTLPYRRQFLRRVLVVVVLVSVAYIPAYWNHDGTLAQPARAVRSQIQPSSRDGASNQYRADEAIDLMNNIRASGILGKGFGIQIAYSVTPVAEVLSEDPNIVYVPHNGVLWVWLRLGIQGEIVLWCLIAAGIIRAVRLARSTDRGLALIGAVVACSLVGYMAEGYEDQGFSEFRIAMAMGCLLGLVEAATRFAQAHHALDADDPAVVNSELAGPAKLRGH